MNFLDRFSRISSISNFIKISPMGTELFCTEELAEREITKITVSFSNFAKRIKTGLKQDKRPDSD
jgi:hypothetical protein